MNIHQRSTLIDFQVLYNQFPDTIILDSLQGGGSLIFTILQYICTYSILLGTVLPHSFHKTIIHKLIKPW